MRRLPHAALVAAGILLLGALGVPKAGAQESLDRTCIGAESAGSASGVAAYKGKWLDGWPGMKSRTGYDPGPYADEEPLYTVTVANMDQYAELLSEGQKALLQKFPDDFRMPVYASHRDFGIPDWVCEAVRFNAGHAQIVHDGLGVTGHSGGIPFPAPKSGLEAVWNVLRPHGVWNETATIDIADVFASGSIAWGRQLYQTLAPSQDPRHPGDNQDKVAAYFFSKMLLPRRDSGKIGIGFQPNDFSDGSTHVWAYDPGTRRLRQAADIAFDYPTPPSGLRTVDDDYAFNGSPERYNWKLVGKREMLIPYDNFRINDPQVPYKTLLTAHTINPDFMRYELHRVWVIEATLKEGFRHTYGRRVLYADEDSWLVPWAESYDMRGALYRISMIAFRYAPDAEAFHRGVSVYHDLSSGAYEAGYLVNEAGDGWWSLNRDDLHEQMFSPQAALRRGH